MKMKDLFYTGSLILLIVLTLVNTGTIETLEQESSHLDGIKNQVDVLSQNVTGVATQVDEQLKEFNKKQLWIADSGMLIEDVQTDKKEATVKVNWTLKELREGEGIVFLYREKNKGEWKEIPASPEKGLNYSITHSFSLKKNYETQISAVSETGKRSEVLMPLDLKAIFDDTLSMGGHVQVMDENNLIVMADAFENGRKEGNTGEVFSEKVYEGLQLKKASLVFYVNGKKVKEHDLLKHNQTIDAETNEIQYRYEEQFDSQKEFGLSVTELKAMKVMIEVENQLNLKFESQLTFYE